MESVRDAVSGGSSGSRVQLRHELAHRSKDDRLALLREAGFAVTETPPPGAGLALKADLTLPWYRLQILRR